MSDSDTFKKSIGKADSRYWQQAGKLLTDPRSRFLFCKIQVNGRRDSFPLRTANKSAAATKAARIYGDVVSLGWDAALAKHKPDEKRTKGALTGNLIREASALADVRPATLASNVAAFRRIVATVAKIDATKGRFARCGDGRGAWLAAVDAVPLAKVTPSAVEAWKLAFVTSRSANDENKARSARNTANATLRSAKSLFSKRLLRFIAPKIELPSPLPFDGVEFFPRQSMRYVSTIDVKKVIAQAGSQLAAHEAVQQAVKAGTIELRPCVVCGSTKAVHGHHDDYHQPLDVTWLCHPYSSGRVGGLMAYSFRHPKREELQAAVKQWSDANDSFKAKTAAHRASDREAFKRTKQPPTDNQHK